MSSARVLVVGSSNTDMVVRAGRIPAPGETVLGGDFVMTAGGKGANQAVAAAKLGAAVAFVARVGRDLFGDAALESIRSAGVDVQYVLRDSEAPSGVALICVDQAGQNSIVVAPGANSRLYPDHLESVKAAFDQCDVVVIQLEIPPATVERAVALARSLSKTVVLNPAPARPLAPSLLRQVDVLVPNEVEAAMLLGWPPGEGVDGVKAARDLLELGVGTAVVTLGEAGAVAAKGQNVYLIPPHKVRAVDSTAAGDCFTAALAIALAEGRNLESAARFAGAAAAVSVTRPGAQASMPGREEAERLLAELH